MNDEVADVIAQGIDVAVRIGELADSRLLSRRLAPYRLSAFASSAYLAEHGTPMHPDDLEAHQTVNFRYQNTGQVFRWPFLIGGRTTEIVPPAGIVVDVSDALVATLAAGGGVGVSATFITAPYVARGELVPVLADFAVERQNITALWPESRQANPAVRAFLNHLQRVFQERMSIEVATGPKSESALSIKEF